MRFFLYLAFVALMPVGESFVTRLPPFDLSNRCRKGLAPLRAEGSDANAEKSISDYTLGLHGGKYQFSDPSINPAALSFTEALYSGGQQVDESYEDDPLPPWAERLSQRTPSDEAIDLVVDSNNGAWIEIENEEMSWERYYAFVVGPGEYTVSPWVGMLEPRGGRDRLRVSKTGVASDPAWLLVGTESEQWEYRLI